MQLQLPEALDNSKLANALHNLCRALLKVWVFAWPLAFPGGVLVMKYWMAGTGVVAPMRTWLGLGRAPPGPTTRTCSPAEEKAYWRACARVRGVLDASDANAKATPAGVPLVRYYAPRLLPRYREVVGDAEARGVYVSPKAFCRWHRMVFPGPMHPSLKEAKEQIKYYSSRDRREILRMSRLLSDEEIVRGKEGWRARYAKIWKKWLVSKGPDLAIVFE